MNRRGFLKAFAGTSVAAVAAPMLLLEGSAVAAPAAVLASDDMMFWPLDDLGPSVDSWSISAWVDKDGNVYTSSASGFDGGLDNVKFYHGHDYIPWVRSA